MAFYRWLSYILLLLMIGWVTRTKNNCNAYSKRKKLSLLSNSEVCSVSLLFPCTIKSSKPRIAYYPKSKDWLWLDYLAWKKSWRYCVILTCDVFSLKRGCSALSFWRDLLGSFMGTSGWKYCYFIWIPQFLGLNKFIDRSSTVTYPSKGLTSRIYSLSFGLIPMEPKILYRLAGLFLTHDSRASFHVFGWCWWMSVQKYRRGVF